MGSLWTTGNSVTGCPLRSLCMYTAPPLRAHGNVQDPPVRTLHQHTERRRNREKREDQYVIPLRSCHYNLGFRLPWTKAAFCG